MAKKKQFVTAAAAFAVAASAVAPAITADAATQTVRLSSDYVRSGNLDATLDKEYKGSEIHWYKSSVDMNKLGVFQTAKGFVKGKGIKVEKSVRVLNFAQDIQPSEEIVLEQGVPASGLRIQPVLFADGNLYNKPVSVSGFETDKVGEFEGRFTYANKAYGSVTKTVKYKVVATKVELTEVKSEVMDDVLSVTANVKNLKDGEKVELVIFPGKDESKAIAIDAVVKEGVVTASAKDLPVGTHSFILRSGEVKTEAMEFAIAAPIVKEVKYINKSEVAVVIEAATADKAGFTISVLNDKGENVAVKPVDVVRGQKEVLFTFEKPLTADFAGVWSIGGYEYDFEAIKKYNAIVDAPNQVALYNALLDASITNVSADYIADYKSAITTDTKKANLADIQAIITKVNAEKAASTVEGAAAKRVNDATNQVQLLEALRAGFARVNSEWIAAYDTALSGELTYAQIQTAVDSANQNQIATAETTVDTVAEANALINTVGTYYVPDSTEKDADTPKADLIADLREAAARYAVNEAPSVLSFYNALVSLANLNDKDALKVSDLNDELKPEYFAEKTDADYTSIETIKSSILAEAAIKAVDTAVTDLGAISVAEGSETSLSQVKTLLTRLANVTKHETGDAKFDLSTVTDSRLASYRAALVDVDTLAEVKGAIMTVNAQADRTVYLEKVRTSTSASEVSDGILALALTDATGVAGARSDLAQAFINAPSQIKLEAAEYVLKERAEFADTAAIESGITLANLFVTDGVLENAIEAHTVQVAKFNAIGDLSTATIAETKSSLDVYAYAPYVSLTAVQKVAVAEEFNKLTKKVGDVYESLDFSDADAVATLKAANAYIDTAIANAR